MSLLLKVAASMFALALAVGPAGAVTASAADVKIVAQAGQIGMIRGTVTDTSGAPLPGATITATGPTSTSTTTGPDGSFTLTLQPGIYQLTASKTGYETASQVDYPVVAGTTSPLSVALSPVTLSTLREIGRVTVSRGRSTFNTSPASIATLNTAVFAEQGQLQVQRVLDQTPGIVIEHPGTSVNNSSPGNITFPAIRGGLGFETASLFDGHPLAVQDFGDYVTTFLSTDLLQNIEVTKGPGSMPTSINYAIGGTFNFRTLDPSAKPTGQIKFGYDSYNGTNSNFRYSNTFLGKLGVMIDYSQYGTPGPLKNAPRNWTIGSSWLFNCASAGAATCQAQNGSTTSAIPGQAAIFQNAPNIGQTSLIVCCPTVNTNYYNRSELVKLRYAFSSATSATVAYIGSQTYADQNGNHVYNFGTTFQPGAGYTSNVFQPGQQVNTWQNIFLPNDFEYNNEPIFEGEIRTTLGRDTILGRYYAASINRLQYTNTSPGNPNDFETFTVNGTVNLCPPGTGSCAAGAATPTVFNNVPVTIEIPNAYFQSPEEDHVHGGTFEYDHFLGNGGSVISAIFDQMSDTSDSWSVTGFPRACAPSAAFPGFCNANPNIPVTSGAAFSSANGGNVFYSVYGGSAVRYSQYLVRGIFQLGPQVNLSLANYLNNYYTKFTLDGGYTYRSSSFNYDVPRAAITWRPSPNVAWRASAGGSISPPYLNLYEGRVGGNPTYSTSTGVATVSVNNPNIRPETAFGYDIGADFRVSGDGLTVFSIDGYTTNLWKQFLASTAQNGTVTVCNKNGGTLPSIDVTGGVPGCGGFGTVTVPLFVTTNGNLDNARYQGLELSVRRDPALGFGFVGQMALIRGYPYNLSPCIYYSSPAQLATCTGTPTTNLAVISGANYYNSGTAGTGFYNSVSNHGIPYANAYLEMHWRTPSGGYLGFGEQYYGPNNSLNEPAFWVATASARLPVGSRQTYFQASVDNLFAAYPNGYETEWGGVPVPLLNGKLGLTNANVIGPRTFHFYLVRNFGY